MTSETKFNRLAEITDTKLDAIVIGGGFAGLVASCLNLARGHSVALLERSERFGGLVNPENRDGFQFGAGFSFYGQEVWQQLFRILETDFEFIALIKHPSLVFHNKKWVEVIDNLDSWEASWLRSLDFVPRGGFGLVVEVLQQLLHKHPQAYLVPEAPITEVSVGPEGVTSIMVGQDVKIRGTKYFWACDEDQLSHVLVGEGAPESGPARISWMKKFVKTPPYPAVAMEFAHRTTVNDFVESLAIPLPLIKKKIQRHVVGAFVSNRDESLAPEGFQLSSWVFPLTEYDLVDNHETMKRIKAAKRTLDRAFAGFADSVIQERIQVLDRSIYPVKKPIGKPERLFDNLIPVAGWASPYGQTYDGILRNQLELLKE